MKYHSTKKSVITIAFIIILLLLISAIGIFSFQAKTPVQATSDAIFSNLEMPNGYSIEIDDINESFLLNQKIKNIKILKNGNTIISIENFSINQSFFNYISYFLFDTKLDFKIIANYIDINLEEDLSDFFLSLSNIKIKDNTIAIQSKLEKKEDVISNNQLDLKNIIDNIINEQNIDLSFILSSDFFNNSFDIVINSGHFNLKEKDIYIISGVSNLNLKLENSGVLNLFNCDFDNFTLNQNNNLLNINNFNISFDNKKITLFTNLFDFSNDNLLIELNNSNFVYDLEKVGQINFDIGKNNILLNQFKINSDKLKGQFKTNFEDYSIIISPTNFYANLNDTNSLSFDNSNIAISYVNNKYTSYYNNEGNLVVIFDDYSYNFRDVDLSLFSSENFFDRANLRIGDLSFNQNDIDFNFSNIDLKINSMINSDIISINNKVDFSKLVNYSKIYKQLNFDISTNININNKLHSIDSELSSSIYLDDFFNTISASMFFDNLVYNELNSKINGEINIQGPIKLKMGNVQTLEASLNYGDFLNLKAIGNIENSIENNEINASILLNDLPMSEISSYINNYAPFLNNYIDEKTLMKGNINYIGNIIINNFNELEGDFTSTLLLKNSVFLDNNYDLSLNTKTNINNSKLYFDNLSASLFNYRVAFNGNYNINNRVINGKINLEDIDKAKQLSYMNLSENNELDSTNFDLYIDSLDSFNLTGSFYNLKNSVYRINSTLSFSKDVLALDIIGDFENLIFSANSKNGLNIDLEIKDSINLNMLFDQIMINSLDNSMFSGNVNLNYINNDQWNFKLNNFSLNYNDRYKFIFDGDINPTSILLNKVDYNNLVFNTYYHGSIEYDGPKYYELYSNNFNLPYLLNITYGDEISQRIEASLFNEENLNNLFLNISNFNIARLFNNDKEILLDTRIIGSSDFKNKNDIKGKIEFKETGFTNKKISVDNNISNQVELEESSIISRFFSLVPFINLPDNNNSSTVDSTETIDKPKISFNTNLKITDNNYLLENLNLYISNISIEDTNFNFDSNNKEISLLSNISFEKESRVSNLKSSSNIDFLINFDSLINSIKEEFSIDTFSYNSITSLLNKFRALKEFDYTLLDNVNGHLNIDNINSFKEVSPYEKIFEETIEYDEDFDDIEAVYNINDGKINLYSNNLKANLNLYEKKGSIKIDKDYYISSDINFTYDNNEFNAFLDDIIFPISLLDKVLDIKLVQFYGDDFVGKLYVKDLFNNPKFYGQLSSTAFKMKTLYTNDNEIIAPNISIIFNEDEIYSNKFDAIYFDKKTNTYSSFYASSKVSMPAFIFDFFEIDLTTNEYIPVYIPLLGMNLTINTFVKNNFNYSTDGKTSYLSGDLIVKDSVISSGVDLLPWIKSVQNTNGDLIIKTDENNTFYYPYIDNPILKLTMAKNQNINIKFDSLTKTYAPTGDIEILQGEIFYFQKNFYINEGSLALIVNPITKRLEPVVSINATLRELDGNGDAIDINLSLNNSTIYNINPVFSSTPIRSQQEIMNILGQSFTTSSNTSGESVASIATAATSVFSSLGYIETGGVASLNKTIASTLNLDFFSLKSNIVENIILETFIEDPRYSSYSPLARYLNNTTIFMGKYITNNSKFQILFNLLAKDDDNTTSFITSDLSLDFEMSYEVDTDLAKFSFFTNPTQLSILKILDTIGFSVTKTIHFR